MDFLSSILECLGSRADSPNKKQKPVSGLKAPSTQLINEEELASSILSALLNAEKSGQNLEDRLRSLVQTTDWYERLAQRILDGLVSALHSGRVTGAAMKEACDKASAAAVEFVREHPVFTEVVVTIVAIGILVIIFPWAVEALGFGELGPVEGSFAALWQSTFPDAEAGSFFAYLQRLGMKWGSR